MKKGSFCAAGENFGNRGFGGEWGGVILESQNLIDSGGVGGVFWIWGGSGGSHPRTEKTLLYTPRLGAHLSLLSTVKVITSKMH